MQVLHARKKGLHTSAPSRFPKSSSPGQKEEQLKDFTTQGNLVPTKAKLYRIPDVRQSPPWSIDSWGLGIYLISSFAHIWKLSSHSGCIIDSLNVKVQAVEQFLPIMKQHNEKTISGYIWASSAGISSILGDASLFGTDLAYQHALESPTSTDGWCEHENGIDEG